MLHEFTDKQLNEKIIVNSDHIVTYNADGEGTCLMLSSGVVRVVTESFDMVNHILRRHFPIIGN